MPEFPLKSGEIGDASRSQQNVAAQSLNIVLECLGTRFPPCPFSREFCSEFSCSVEARLTLLNLLHKALFFRRYQIHPLSYGITLRLGFLKLCTFAQQFGSGGFQRLVGLRQISAQRLN